MMEGLTVTVGAVDEDVTAATQTLVGALGVTTLLLAPSVFHGTLVHV